MSYNPNNHHNHQLSSTMKWKLNLKVTKIIELSIKTEIISFNVNIRIVMIKGKEDINKYIDHC